MILPILRWGHPDSANPQMRALLVYCSENVTEGHPDSANPDRGGHPDFAGENQKACTPQ